MGTHKNIPMQQLEPEYSETEKILPKKSCCEWYTIKNKKKIVNIRRDIQHLSNVYNNEITTI